MILNVMNEDKNRQILHDRALVLAKEYSTVGEHTQWIEVTTFRLGGELYALESEMIREIIPLKEFTPLPGLPQFIAGIMNLRGKILSLLDLHNLFGLTGESVGKDCKVVVLSNDKMEFGIMTDSINGIERIVPSALQMDVSVLGTTVKKYLRGLTAERLILLDAVKLLSDPALLVNEEI